MRPHRRQPTRLPHPWDFPDKNTGVGCHFLLQCIKVKSESEVAQSCPTLSDPMDCSLPGSSIHGIFQARVLEWGVLTIYLILAQCHFPWTWLPISPVFFPFCPYLTRRWGVLAATCGSSSAASAVLHETGQTTGKPYNSHILYLPYELSSCVCFLFL